VEDKVIVWLHGEVKSPPMSTSGRLELGYLLRCLQRGDLLSMPFSRQMQSIGSRCHELRVRDRFKDWRLIYRIDNDAIIILDVFEKKTNQTPNAIIVACKRRLVAYDRED
jgi:phage-related protein